MRDRVRRVTGSVRVRVALVAMLLVGGVLVVSGIVLTRTVKHRLEEENRERADQTVAYAADRLEAGVAVDSVFASSAAPGNVFMVLRLADGTVIASQQPGPFTIPIGATESAVAGSAGLSFDSSMAVPPPGSQIVTRVVDLPEGESVLVGVSPLDDVRESVGTLVNALWWGSPVLVLLVGLIAWVLVGRALRPVEQLRATVETISRSTLEQRVDVPPSHDEVARLATTMNTMLERLQRSRDHERRFVSDASHELRSPLASIRAQLEVGDAIDNGTIRAGVLADTIRLERIVGDLMELARSDETTARPNGSVALDVVVADEITALQRSSPIQITSAGIDDTVVRGRSDALARVTRNLLDNAIRHAEGEVHIGLHHANGWAELTVDDDGPGVPVDAEQRIFDRFARLDESRDRTTGGVGLGLAVVRAVVEHHGGTVACARSPLGGARFLVRLPVTA
ncbi:MAG TPA: HAMP domain-containing sensor histidine kinase [Ilumatobacteraceae bacterium]|nr:HAMP domain-containing sensor histidine kinase [Ilumatobacteraceae bacterium]